MVVSGEDFEVGKEGRFRECHGRLGFKQGRRRRY